MTPLRAILLVSFYTMVSHGKPIHLLNTTSPQATPLDMLKLTVTIGFSENEPELQRLLQLVARLVMEQNAKANATGNHPIEERMGSTAASFVDGTEASESNGTVDEQSTVQLAEVSSRHQRDLTGSAEPTSGLATAVNGGQSVEGTCWMSQQHIENVIGTAWSLKHAADDMFKTYCKQANATLTRHHRNMCLSDHEVHHMRAQGAITHGHNTPCPPRGWVRHLSHGLDVLGKRASSLATRGIQTLQDNCEDICAVSCQRQPNIEPLANMTCRFDTVLLSKVDNIVNYVNRLLGVTPSPPNTDETNTLSDRPSDVIFLRLLKNMLRYTNILLHGLEASVQYNPAFW